MASFIYDKGISVSGAKIYPFKLLVCHRTRPRPIRGRKLGRGLRAVRDESQFVPVAYVDIMEKAHAMNSLVPVPGRSLPIGFHHDQFPVGNLQQVVCACLLAFSRHSIDRKEAMITSFK